MAKLEEKELQELKQAIALPNQIANEIGIIKINYERIPELIEAYKNSIKDRDGKLKEVEEKHGKGSLNIDTGEITPINEE
jgi:hypothetical protein